MDVLGLDADASSAGIVLYVAAMIVPAVHGCDVLQLESVLSRAREQRRLFGAHVAPGATERRR